MTENTNDTTQETTTEAAEAATPTTEVTLDDRIQAEVLRVLDNPDPDGTTVSIRAAYRNLGCSGSGPECYRRVRYPGKTSEDWPDSDRLPARGIRAAERRCSVYCDVPVGTIVVDFERQVYKGSRGKCKVSIGVAIAHPDTGKGHIVWYDHRTLRSRPVYECKLPGRTIEVERREH
jgi:hypothetical protein